MLKESLVKQQKMTEVNLYAEGGDKEEKSTLLPICCLVRKRRMPLWRVDCCSGQVFSVG